MLFYLKINGKIHNEFPDRDLYTLRLKKIMKVLKDFMKEWVEQYMTMEMNHNLV